MIRIALVLLAAALSWPASAVSVPAPVPSGPPMVCRPGIVHVALLSEAQLCPRPLAMAKTQKPRHGTLRT